MNIKIKILIASVLKPVDDVRSFHKIGRSLAQTNKYDVNIIGFKSKKINKHKNISFHPIYDFKRTSISRLASSWKFYKSYLKVKPQVIIVSSPELLIVTYIIRILFGTTILYDIQENYEQNLKYGSTYSKFLKPFLNTILKVVEHSSRYFVSYYLLAERVYEDQLDFVKGKKCLILENKALRPSNDVTYALVSFSTSQPISIVYTGTIGKEYGTLEGIAFVKKLLLINSNISLKVIGYSADEQYLKLINKSIESIPFIQLIGGKEPVPYSEITEAIHQSDMAILPYEVNTNIKQRIPTKFYDYMAYNKPMIVSKNEPWEKLLSIYPAALFIDFNSTPAQLFLEELKNMEFYNKPVDETIYWDFEAQKLIDFMKELNLK